MRLMALAFTAPALLCAGLAWTAPAEVLPAVDDSSVPLGQDPGPPATLWAVRIGGLGTAVDTEEIARQLSGRGYSAVSAFQEGPVRSVLAGVFEYQVDAELCREDLAQRGFRRVSIEPIPATADRTRAIERRLPVEPVFRLEAEHISQTASPEFDADSDPLIQQARAAAALRTPEGDAELERLAASLPETDARRARVTLDLAHRYNWRREYDRALDLYQAIADGAYPVRRADRINAMTNVGWVLMYRTPEYRRAYRAYREIELFTGSDTVRANALAEQAWIMFEILRHDGVGSWPEVRRFCARAIASFDAGDSEQRAMHRAVLELIHLETYFQERDYESTARCARAFLDAYRGVPERRREVAMATSWLGISQVNLNQLGEAKGTLEGLIAMEVRPSENFGGENMDRLAASWLFHIADLQRDASAMHFWGEYLAQNHSGTRAQQHAATRLSEIAALGW